MIFRVLGTLMLISVAGCGGAPPPPDPHHLAGAKDSLSRGNYWFALGCFQEASRFFQGGLESARRSDNVLLIIRAQNSLGAAALARGETDLAAGYMDQALNLVLGQPGQPELDKVLGNLGALAYALGRHQDAEDCWGRAAEAAVERGRSPAPYYCDLARLYLRTQRPEFAGLAAKALAAAEGPEETKTASAKTGPADIVTLADALNVAGQAALAADDLGVAEERFRRALDLDRQSENTVGLAQDTEALGRVMTRLGRPQEALGFFDRAFFLWLAVGDDAAADRIFAEIAALAKGNDFFKNLSPYREARRNPEPHRLASQCPTAADGGPAEAPAPVPPPGGKARSSALP